MARPKKKKTDKLNDVFPPIRCMDSDKDFVRKRAKQTGVSMSEFIRCMAVEGQIIVEEVVLPFDPALIFQVQSIGNNLNQLVRISNTTGEFIPGLDQLIEKISILSDQMIDQIELTQIY